MTRRKSPRDTVDLFMAVRKLRYGRYRARCKMIGCTWSEDALGEMAVTKRWIQHFTREHVAKWDKR